MKDDFNILVNGKIRNRPISSVSSGIPFVFPMCFGPDEDHHQIKRNLRNLLIIYMLMTSTQKINKICNFNFFRKKEERYD